MATKVAQPLRQLALAVAHSSLQWTTLAWVAGAVLAAALIITVIVVVSRRPKSMEEGMEEFSRSLQAVAPVHRPLNRPLAGQPRSRGNGQQSQSGRPVRAKQEEAEPV